MKKFHFTQFKYRIFFSCGLVALLPLFLTSFFLVRIFDMSLKYQALTSGESQNRQAVQVFAGFLSDCEYACRSLDQSAATILIDSTDDCAGARHRACKRVRPHFRVRRVKALERLGIAGGSAFKIRDVVCVVGEKHRRAGRRAAVDAAHEVVDASRHQPRFDRFNALGRFRCVLERIRQLNELMGEVSRRQRAPVRIGHKRKIG